MLELSEKIQTAKESGFGDTEILDRIATKKPDYDARIQQARKAGYTDADIITRIISKQPEQQTKDITAEIPQEKPYGWKDAVMDTLVGAGGAMRNIPSQKIKENIAAVVRPTLEGVGMGVGATVGNTIFPVFGGMGDIYCRCIGTSIGDKRTAGQFC
jgi:hypothetical protein